MTTPTPPPVHWVQDKLHAVTETDGHGDDCGVIVIQDYLHALQGTALTQAQTSQMRGQLLNAGLFGAGSGMTIEQVAAGMRYYQGPAPTKIRAWGTINLDELHADLKAIGDNHWAVVVETHNASALPDNQPGVQNHFILAWGIDSALGYYCANGDTLTALGTPGSVPPVWYSWNNIVASLAGQGAYLIWPALATTPPIPPQPPLDVAGAIVDIHAAQASLAAALTKLGA